MLNWVTRKTVTAPNDVADMVNTVWITDGWMLCAPKSSWCCLLHIHVVGHFTIEGSLPIIR